MAVPAPPERFNFAGHILDANARRAAKVAYIDDAGQLTYGELAERVRRFASALRELGVQREQRVLLLMHDSNDWPVVFLGSLYAGVVPVAINTLLTPADYAYMLEHSRAQAAFVSAPLLPTLQAAMKQAAHEMRTLVVSRGDPTTEALDFEKLLGRNAPLAAPASTGAEEPAFWLYSSGSTGRPKGTVHTQANLYWTAELYGKPVLGLNESDLCFSAAKLFFAYGLGNALTFPLSVGASVLLMAERPTQQAVFKRWLERRPTVFFGAPTGYAGMLAAPNLPPRDAVACACALPPGRRCLARSAIGSIGISAARSSTDWARPRCCISSSPIVPAKCATGRRARRSRDIVPSCAMTWAA
jgi:benzoate-CoA ligase